MVACYRRIVGLHRIDDGRIRSWKEARIGPTAIVEAEQRIGGGRRNLGGIGAAKARAIRGLRGVKVIVGDLLGESGVREKQQSHDRGEGGENTPRSARSHNCPFQKRRGRRVLIVGKKVLKYYRIRKKLQCLRATSRMQKRKLLLGCRPDLFRGRKPSRSRASCRTARHDYSATRSLRCKKSDTKMLCKLIHCLWVLFPLKRKTKPFGRGWGRGPGEPLGGRRMAERFPRLTHQDSDAYNDLAAASRRKKWITKPMAAKVPRIDC